MLDILNGKLIYQLTSASALKDADLFAISTSDNLTRSVSLGQIKSAVANDFYNKNIIDSLLDDVKSQIQDVSNDNNDLENDLSEFRNEFNTKLHELNSQLRTTINDTKSELNTNINNTNTSLTNKINDTNTRIDNLFVYGMSIPTKLEPGKIYLQYF